MPGLGAAGTYEAGGADDLADQPGVDRVPRGLHGAAQESVGSRAQQASAARRGFEDGPALLDGDGERLLRVDVLSGVQRGDGGLRVELRRRDVDDDLDAVVGEKFGVVPPFRDAEFGGGLLGAGRVDVGDADHFQLREITQAFDVTAEYVARAQNPDAVPRVLLSHESPALSCQLGGVSVEWRGTARQAAISGRSVRWAISRPVLTFSSVPLHTGSSCSTESVPVKPFSYRASTTAFQSTWPRPGTR